MFLLFRTACSKSGPDSQPAAKLRGRPPIPDPGYPDDSLYLVANPDHPGATYYRRLAWIQFAESAADLDVTQFFPRFAAEIVGGVRATGTYYIRFPDPGPTWAQVDSVVQLRSETPGVAVATEIAEFRPKARLDDGAASDSQSGLRPRRDSGSGGRRPQ